jgi:hypothetical protein
MDTLSGDRIYGANCGREHPISRFIVLGQLPQGIYYTADALLVALGGQLDRLVQNLAAPTGMVPGHVVRKESHIVQAL